MQVGYFTMPLHPPGSDPAVTMEADLVQMETLDRLGYREAWIGEHFTTVWENIPAPDQFIAAALSRTKDLVFGTGVTCMPNHDPFMIAHRVAQLDNLAKGRFHWGVGSGGFPGDFEVFGFDASTGAHRGMSRDSIELILQMWENPAPGVYEHPFWKFNIPEPVPEIGLQFHMTPYQKPHPPIGVAGVSAKSETLVFAGEKGWLPLSINLVPTETLKTHWDAVEEGAARSGRTPDRSQWRIAKEIYVAETTEEARYEVLNGTIGAISAATSSPSWPTWTPSASSRATGKSPTRKSLLNTSSTTFGSSAASTTLRKSSASCTKTLAVSVSSSPWATSGNPRRNG